MVIEVFSSVLTGLATGYIKDGLQKAFRALVEAEIHQTDLNKSVREPFLTALEHLADADREPNETKRKTYIEYARLKFVEASNLDAPIYAARAACYVGICHYLQGHIHLDARCYQRSLDMFSAMEARLFRKLRPYDKIIKIIKLIPIPRKYLPFLVGDPLAAAVYQRWLFLTKQVTEIQEYKKPVTNLVDARKYSNGGQSAASGSFL